MNLQLDHPRAETHDIAEDGYRYRVSAWWTADGAGLAKSDLAPNALHFAAPPEFGGLQGRWTPEALLLSAVASCFTTTFQAIAGYSKLEYTDLEVDVEGVVTKANSGYELAEIIIRPQLIIPTADEQRRALELLRKVHSLCLVSRAISVEQKFEPKVEVGKMATIG